MRYQPSAEDPILGPTPVGAAEDGFADYVRAQRQLGYGRMIQIVGHIWEEAQPSFGKAHAQAQLEAHAAQLCDCGAPLGEGARCAGCLSDATLRAHGQGQEGGLREAEARILRNAEALAEVQRRLDEKDAALAAAIKELAAARQEAESFRRVSDAGLFALQRLGGIVESTVALAGKDASAVAVVLTPSDGEVNTVAGLAMQEGRAAFPEVGIAEWRLIVRLVVGLLRERLGMANRTLREPLEALQELAG